MAPSLSRAQRMQIVALRESGQRVCEICQVMGVTRRTVYLWLKRYAAEGSLEAHRRSLYQRATSTEQDRAIVAAHSKDPFLSTRVTSSQHNISLETVRRRLRAGGLGNRKQAKKTNVEPHRKEDQSRCSMDDRMSPEEEQPPNAASIVKEEIDIGHKPVQPTDQHFEVQLELIKEEPPEEEEPSDVASIVKEEIDIGHVPVQQTDLYYQVKLEPVKEEPLEEVQPPDAASIDMEENDIDNTIPQLMEPHLRMKLEPVKEEPSECTSFRNEHNIDTTRYKENTGESIQRLLQEDLNQLENGETIVGEWECEIDTLTINKRTNTSK